MRQSVARFAYGGMPFDALTGVLSSFLPGFEKVLSTAGRTWIAGAKLTIADFTLWEVVDQARTIVADLAKSDMLAPYPALAAYMARFEALPAITAYHASPRFVRVPYNNKVAVWTGVAPAAGTAGAGSA